MSPAEDAKLLLRIVRRHLLAMQLNLDPSYPEEEWGFQAQQALEKLLKAKLVLSNLAPKRSHELALLAEQAGEELPNVLLKLQVFAVEARYEEGPFALPADRESLLADFVARLDALETAILDQGEAIQ
ncbi:HEPN domain-containing protein [Cyanobium sp. WAJ14-Wanaka]|uniref:HEPN domain-containing protein n=1 Tax=Cyanobium sp. WAJ14-Wanaka TaxID=2823725 RepID=UPI0020CFBF1B|nr:HEPN domain-containing protein [Cyanobium sp. WAJ14-Wanaka]MCP9775778.1 HEPN domain-containing protein [Cyanobium sp. WAJ14-Wanaka]